MARFAVTERVPRGSLNLDRIVEAATTVILRDGLAEMSMRRVAEELGASTMALYRHVPTKKELVNAVAEHYLSEINLPDVAGLPWRDAIAASMGAMYESFLAHPELGEIFALQRIDAVAIFRVSDAILSALLDAGLSRRNAILALDALHCYGMGFTQRKAEFRSGGATAAARAGKIERLDLGSYGAVAELAGDIAMMDLQIDFEDGLRFVLDGIGMRLRHHNDDNQTT